MKRKIRKAELRWRTGVSVADPHEAYGQRVVCSRDVVSLAEKILEREVHEVFVVFFLDNKNRVLGYQEIARGGMNAIGIAPRDVFRGALLAVAAAIIVAHNHPSGLSAPSDEDVTFTKRLQKAGKILGVQLLDHVVVGDGENFSFLDSGMLRDRN